MIELVQPEAGELEELRCDPLLWEQELDCRPEVAEAIERAVGARTGRFYWRSGHDLLYGLELGDLGRGRPSTALVCGFWERFEPRPPEHEIDADLVELCLWVAEIATGLEVEDVARVFQFAGVDGSWPEGSVRRPEPDRFEAAAADYPYEPRFVEVEGLRIAYVEAGGAASDETVLMLHGEPTWGYLYRHMIPPLSEVARVVVPDLVGFGRSDKPVAENAYSYRSHLRWLRKTVRRLELDSVTLVCQDWGGLLGLRLLAEEPSRFRRLVAMNTGLPAGEPAPEAFLQWRRFSQRLRFLDVPVLMRRAVRRPGFREEEAVAYGLPFSGAEEQAAARVFPRLVPIRPSDPGARGNRQAAERLAELDLPVLLPWGAEDEITLPWRDRLLQLFPQAESFLIAGAGHFVQEEAGERLAERVVRWMQES